MKILISLPDDRHQRGVLSIMDGDTAVYRCPCLGKSDNATAARKGNPKRDPTFPYGDTPLGKYEVTFIWRRASYHRTLGWYGIPLDPINTPDGGDAYTAEQNGRTALVIHGGRSQRSGNGNLIPTFGCIRVFDDHMDDIARVLGKSRVPVEIVRQNELPLSSRADVDEIVFQLSKLPPEKLRAIARGLGPQIIAAAITSK